MWVCLHVCVHVCVCGGGGVGGLASAMYLSLCREQMLSDLSDDRITILILWGHLAFKKMFLFLFEKIF